MASNPKRARGPGARGPNGTAETELPFDEGEVAPLRADDPSPQRTPQYPSGMKRPARKHGQGSDPNSARADRALEPSYDPHELSDSGRPRSLLYVEKGPGAGQLVPLKPGVLVIGRASVADLRLQHPSISRRHAQVTRNGERFYIRDLGSQNGTFVNRNRIATEVEIQPGDEIAVGTALLRLRGGGAQQLARPATTPVPNSTLGASDPTRLRDPEPAKEVRRAAAPSYAATTAKSGPSMLKVAAIAGAVGFVVAGVVLFVLVKFPGVLGAENVVPRPRAEVAPAEPTIEMESDPVVRPLFASEEDNQKVEAALAEAMKARAVELETNPEPEPTPEEIPEGVLAEPSRSLAMATPSPRSEGTSAPSSRETIVSRYESGNLVGALDLARSSRDTELLSKLTKFQQAYDAARAAVKANNGTSAIRNYETALKFDEQISNGWSTFGTEIRKELSGLLVLVAQYHQSNRNTDAAKKALELALKHNPANSKARSLMGQLTPSAAKPRPVKSKIDDAFNEEPVRAPSKPVKTKAATRSAIDDAFND